MFGRAAITLGIGPHFYTMGHKKGANLFFSVTLSIVNGFDAVFTVIFTNEQYM